MKILVVGSGGREHALLLKCKESPLAEKLFCAPGNGGTAEIARNVDIQATDLAGLADFTDTEGIDLVIIGPEAPLVLGLADRLRKGGCKVVGPSAAAARLEGSKDFAKEFMTRHNIPTASFRSFTGNQIDEALDYCRGVKTPTVLKADGLAGGKGVIICESNEHAVQTMEAMLSGDAFGSAGRRVVVEEFMEGEEASVFAVSDGKDYVLLSTAQDHKRVGEGDIGPNTGGMGAYAPAPIMTSQLLEEVRQKVVEPSINGMAREGHPFNGFLYIGLMITQDGPKVVEYNCRMGDPETQVVMPLIKSDFVSLMSCVAEGGVADYPLELSKDFMACVVLASGGYPSAYETGYLINGLEAASNHGTLVFHAGTKRQNDGSYITTGGRVLAVSGRAGILSEAIKQAYVGIEEINFEKSFFRKDIGQKGLRRIENLDQRV